jgi:hypothetical protein
MKKLIILIAMFVFTISATSQEYQVVDIKPIDNVAKEEIQMLFEKITRTQREFYTKMKAEELLTDSIQFKGKIDTLFINMWTVHKLFETSMSIPDTISIYKVEGKFYTNQLGLGTDLITERQNLIDKYAKMVEKYGSLAKYEAVFQKMKRRYDRIQNWEKQIVQ